VAQYEILPPHVFTIPFEGNADFFSAQGSPPKVLSVIRGLLNNIKIEICILQIGTIDK
jgi:hypothetical protein